IEKEWWRYVFHGGIENAKMKEVRATELEADRQGLLYAAKAGYDVSSVDDFVSNMARFHKNNPAHPVPQSRAAQLRKFIPGAMAQPKAVPVENLAAIQKLIK